MVSRVAVVVVAVVAVTVCAVVATLLLVLLGRGGAGAGAGEAVARPAEVVWNGWVLRVEYLAYSGNSLAIRVNCTNTAGGSWYVEPKRQFYLVLDSGEELRPRDTTLQFGFYYVKRRESIAFDVLFVLRPGARPAKLVYRGDVDLEVPLASVPRFRSVRLERSAAIIHVGHHDQCISGVDVEYIQTFKRIPLSVKVYRNTILVPLNSNTTSITLKITNLDIVCACRVTIKTVNASVRVLSLSPKELVLEPGDHGYVEMELEVPEGVTSVKLHMDIEVRPIPR